MLLRLIANIKSFIMSSLMLMDALRVAICSPDHNRWFQRDICSSPIMGIPSGGHVISESFFCGLCLTLLGGLFRAWAQNSLGSFFTFELTIKPDHRLITTGPYSLVRHPSYLGSLVTKTGLTMMQLSKGSVLQDYGQLAGGWQMVAISGFRWMTAVYSLSIVLWMIKRTKLEDGLLKGQFGKEWTEWATRTPYRVIPFVL